MTTDSGRCLTARAATPSGLSRFASSCKHCIAIAARFVRDAKYEVLYRVSPRHKFHIVRTGLKPGYYDQDYRMLHACFALLVDLADEELGMVRSLADKDPPASYIEMAEAHIAEMEAEPEKWVGGGEYEINPLQRHIDQDRELVALYRWWTIDRPAQKAALEAMPASKKWAEMDSAQDDEDQAMFMRLAAVRRGLWV